MDREIKTPASTNEEKLCTCELSPERNRALQTEGPGAEERRHGGALAGSVWNTATRT